MLLNCQAKANNFFKWKKVKKLIDLNSYDHDDEKTFSKLNRFPKNILSILF